VRRQPSDAGFLGWASRRHRERWDEQTNAAAIDKFIDVFYSRTRAFEEGIAGSLPAKDGIRVLLVLCAYRGEVALLFLDRRVCPNLEMLPLPRSLGRIRPGGFTFSTNNQPTCEIWPEIAGDCLRSSR
jgi:hypothetical protein